MQEEPKIQDIASHKKLRNDAQTLKQLNRVYPLLRPVLKLLKVDVTPIEHALAQADNFDAAAQELTTIGDRFNALFGSRGWIMYGMMDYEAAKAAVKLGESGDIDGAEVLLVDHYNEETIDWGIKFMNAVAAFRPRTPLARKALDDYIAGRYHACVPVVLALLDGTVNDLGPVGFFAQGVNLKAWDSIAAHGSGLASLSKLLGKTRKKRTTEQLTIPYRNGILHGMDLGYDNKMVAAKAWAALFAIREWAIKVERGQTEEPAPEPKKSWGTIFQQLRDLADDKERLATWSPREIRLGENTVVSGQPDGYADGTPEQKLAEFFLYWGMRNYGKMAQCLSVENRKQLNRTAGQLRDGYAGKKLKAFEITELIDNAPAVTTAKVRVKYEENDEQFDSTLEMRLINENADGHGVTRGKPGSRWSLYTGYL